MTCIVGYIHNGKVCIAGDKLASNWATKQIHEQSKVFAKGDVVFGYTSSFRFGQLIEYHLDKFIYDSTKEIDYIIKVVIVKIKAVLKEYEYSEKECGVALVAINDKLFVLQSDFSVLDINKYASVGSGEYFALGSIYSSINTKKPKTKSNVEDILKLAIGAAAYHSTSVSEESTIIWT